MNAFVSSFPVRRIPTRVLWTIWLVAAHGLLAAEVGLIAVSRVDPNHYPTRAAFEHARDLMAYVAVGLYWLVPVVVLLIFATRIGLRRWTALLLLIPALNLVLWIGVLWRLTSLPHRPWAAGSTKYDPLSESL